MKHSTSQQFVKGNKTHLSKIQQPNLLSTAKSQSRYQGLDGIFSVPRSKTRCLARSETKQETDLKAVDQASLQPQDAQGELRMRVKTLHYKLQAIKEQAASLEKSKSKAIEQAEASVKAQTRISKELGAADAEATAHAREAMAAEVRRSDPGKIEQAKLDAMQSKIDALKVMVQSFASDPDAAAAAIDQLDSGVDGQVGDFDAISQGVSKLPVSREPLLPAGTREILEGDAADLNTYKQGQRDKEAADREAAYAIKRQAEERLREEVKRVEGVIAAKEAAARARLEESRAREQARLMQVQKEEEARTQEAERIKQLQQEEEQRKREMQEEEQKRREEEERRQMEEDKRRQEEQRRREEEQRAQEEQQKILAENRRKRDEEQLRLAEEQKALQAAQRQEEMRMLEEKKAQAALAAQEQARRSSPEGLLGELTAKAMQSGKRIVIAPDGAVTPGTTARILYDASRSHQLNNINRPLQIKLGLNDWETKESVALEPIQIQPPPGTNQGEWHAGDLYIPEDTWSCVCVVCDDLQERWDNNDNQNFIVELQNAKTQPEVMELRDSVKRAIVARRTQVAADADAALYREAEARAQSEGLAAAERTKQSLDIGLRQQSAQEVVDRQLVPREGIGYADAVPGKYRWSPSPPVAGTTCRLEYNSDSGPLQHSNGVVLHVGYDGWWKQIVTTYECAKMGKAGAQSLVNRNGTSSGTAPEEAGTWWSVDVAVPATCVVLDFVFSDEKGDVWDNNNMVDFHVQVFNALTNDKLEQLVYEENLKIEHDHMLMQIESAQQHAVNGIISKCRAAIQRRRRSMAAVFSEPFAPVPGESLDIYYKPPATNPLVDATTALYAIIGFNNWKINLPAPLVLNRIACQGLGPGWHHCTTTVPKEATSVQLVATNDGPDRPGDEPATYDNNRGKDYKLLTDPLSVGHAGEVGKKLNVVHVTVEMAPIAKVGGLGDVVTALGRAVQDAGHNVQVIIPKYDCIKYDDVEGLAESSAFHMENVRVRVWQGVVQGLNVTFLEPENGMFWVGCIYGRNDDAHRFGFFATAAVEYLRHTQQKVNIIHAHDWQTAPAAWAPKPQGDTRIVFTIHNLNYGADLIGRAMQACDVATTVSPNYAEEISQHPAIQPHASKFSGIINGIDTGIWDPSSPSNLPQPYDVTTVREGKAAARAMLADRYNLQKDGRAALVGVVTRLTPQKGIHLIKHAAWKVLESGAMFVLLGSAPDPSIQADFYRLSQDLNRQFHGRVALEFTYDEPLSHQIYAASDMILVPSMFEPCGLTQLIAMRYGAIPVVRYTGGLADTVHDVQHGVEAAEEAGRDVNGFVFEGTDTDGIEYALNRALELYNGHPEDWHQLRQNVMNTDWSWSGPSLDYLDLYESEE